MDEDLIRACVPDLYTALQSDPDVDWTQLKLDLGRLNWLELTEETLSVLSEAWKIADEIGIALIEKSSRYNTLLLPKVKLYLISSARELMLSEGDDAQVVGFCFNAMEELKFFTVARDAGVAGRVTKAEARSAFEGLKESMRKVIGMFEKPFKLVTGDSLFEYVDSAFQHQVLPFIVGEDPPTDHKAEEHRTEEQQPQPPPPADKAKYVGEVVEDSTAQGFGKCVYANGDSYEGYWQASKPHGLGVYVWKSSGRYEGEFFEGLMHGAGKREFVSGAVYTGDFRQSTKSGQGVQVFANHDRYDGEWLNDNFHGQGTYTWASGGTASGEFAEGKQVSVTFALDS
jgi:hypothetical protein